MKYPPNPLSRASVLSQKFVINYLGPGEGLMSAAKTGGIPQHSDGLSVLSAKERGLMGASIGKDECICIRRKQK